jgi:hypothetical protein
MANTHGIKNIHMYICHVSKNNSQKDFAQKNFLIRLVHGEKKT